MKFWSLDISPQQDVQFIHFCSTNSVDQVACGILIVTLFNS